jgi:tetratricopeptide (TPR) repeat protein
LEAFRRALRLKPLDGKLLYEFAKCLHAYAAIEKDPRLDRRARAALRLAERRLAGDSDSLARVGEFYSSLGEFQRSGALYQSVVDTVGDNFRALRGMAEMALSEGKIAHVIHNFAAADRVAETAALRRWARNEAEYFSHLHSNDEYMEMEISRVNLLDALERSQRTALRISSIAFPAVVIGLLLEDELITNIGWAVSAVAVVIWAGLILAAKMFARRIPFELIDTDT